MSCHVNNISTLCLSACVDNKFRRKKTPQLIALLRNAGSQSQLQTPHNSAGGPAKCSSRCRILRQTRHQRALWWQQESHSKGTVHSQACNDIHSSRRSDAEDVRSSWLQSPTATNGHRRSPEGLGSCPQQETTGCQRPPRRRRHAALCKFRRRDAGGNQHHAYWHVRSQRSTGHTEALPSVILYDKRQLNDIKGFCFGGKAGSVLVFDKTYNLGAIYVTPSIYKNLALCRRWTNDSPMFLGPIFVHGHSDFDIYAYFFGHLSACLVACNQ